MSKVLITDDDKDLADSIGDLLEDMGYEPVIAENGEVALKEYKKDPLSFSLIISDIRMPKMDGVDLLKSVKEINKDQKFVFVFMTGFSDFSKKDLISLGAIDVLIKPIDYQNLENILEKISAA